MKMVLVHPVSLLPIAIVTLATCLIEKRSPPDRLGEYLAHLRSQPAGRQCPSLLCIVAAASCAARTATEWPTEVARPAAAAAQALSR